MPAQPSSKILTSAVRLPAAESWCHPAAKPCPLLGACAACWPSPQLSTSSWAGLGVPPLLPAPFRAEKLLFWSQNCPGWVPSVTAGCAKCLGMWKERQEYAHALLFSLALVFRWGTSWLYFWTIWYFLAQQTCLLARGGEDAGCREQACILPTSGPQKMMLCSRAEHLRATFLSKEECLGC